MSTKKEDYYELLGVSKSSTKEEISKGYKKAALRWHPDRNPPENKEAAEEMFKKIAKANEILQDDEKREIYDRFGEDGLQQGGGGMPANFNPFEMFGSMGNMFGGMRQDKQEERPIVHEVKCTLKDSYIGVKKNEMIERYVFCTPCEGTGFKDKKVHTCSTCNGKGVQIIIHQLGPGMVQQATRSCTSCKGSGSDSGHIKCERCDGSKKIKEISKIEIEVKKGTKRNPVPIILKGKGSQTGPSTYGDLAVLFTFENDPVYTRKGNDLHRRIDISLRKALLGFQLTLDHLDGKKIVIQSEEVIQPLSVKKISHMGFLDQSTNITGDYFIEFNVIFPEKYNSKQLKALDLVLHKEIEDDSHKKIDSLHHYKLEFVPIASNKYYDHLDEDDQTYDSGPAEQVQCAQQ
jgi:DnaJ family protein A protein 2